MINYYILKKNKSYIKNLKLLFYNNKLKPEIISIIKPGFLKE